MLKPGVYSLTQAEYFALPAVSRSELWDMKGITDAAYKHLRANPKPPSNDMMLGTAVHTLCFEPQDMAYRFPEAPKVHANTNEFKEWKAALKPDQLRMPDGWLDLAKEMHAALVADPFASKLLKGYHEKTFVWLDEETGLLCKCKPDVTHFFARILVDLKKTDDASPEAFAMSVYKYGYYFQNAFYIDGVTKAFEQSEIKLDLPGVPDRFAFLAVEDKPPYQKAYYELEPYWIDQGRREVRALLNRYKAYKDREAGGQLQASFESRIKRLEPKPFMIPRERP